MILICTIACTYKLKLLGFILHMQKGDDAIVDPISCVTKGDIEYIYTMIKQKLERHFEQDGDEKLDFELEFLHSLKQEKGLKLI